MIIFFIEGICGNNGGMSVSLDVPSVLLLSGVLTEKVCRELSGSSEGV